MNYGLDHSKIYFWLWIDNYKSCKFVFNDDRKHNR